ICRPVYQQVTSWFAAALLIPLQSLVGETSCPLDIPMTGRCRQNLVMRSPAAVGAGIAINAVHRAESACASTPTTADRCQMIPKCLTTPICTLRARSSDVFGRASRELTTKFAHTALVNHS